LSCLLRQCLLLVVLVLAWLVLWCRALGLMLGLALDPFELLNN